MSGGRFSMSGGRFSTSGGRFHGFSGFQVDFHGFSWFQFGFSCFFCKMYPPELYPGPTNQSRSAARWAAKDLVSQKNQPVKTQTYVFVQVGMILFTFKGISKTMHTKRKRVLW